MEQRQPQGRIPNKLFFCCIALTWLIEWSWYGESLLDNLSPTKQWNRIQRGFFHLPQVLSEMPGNWVYFVVPGIVQMVVTTLIFLYCSRKVREHEEDIRRQLEEAGDADWFRSDSPGEGDLISEMRVIPMRLWYLSKSGLVAKLHTYENVRITGIRGTLWSRQSIEIIYTYRKPPEVSRQGG